MRAWRLHRLGEPQDVWRIDEVDRPSAAGGTVVVRVAACALNFPDALISRGEYQERPDLPFTPGMEVFGEVVEVGTGVSRWAVGDQVIGMPRLPHGGLAEFAMLAATDAFPACAALDEAENAALLIAYQTGWFALHRRAGLQAGETLLVHAGAGGVGSAAIQLGKAAGAQVIAVVGGAEKAEVCRKLGADVVVDRRSDDFVSVVKEVTGGRGADVVFDPVGGETFERSTKCIAFEGRIVVIGFAGGRIASAATNHVLIKNYSVVGLHWGLYRSKNPALIDEAHAALDRLATKGLIRPLVSERLAFAAAADGITRLASGKTVGRLVVRPGT